ncbi:MAG: thiamine pyrophosphate-dependent enzyme [Patescibacteria group bacterium]
MARIVSGNTAVALGALAAGCRFFAGYPITPSTQILEEMKHRLPEVGGIFYQPEDELAAIGMITDASMTGLKAMTATSGPGLSLIQEEIGRAIINETPLVIIDVMRVGPSTGQPTKPASSDINCLINGRHGDGGDCVVVLAPTSVQDCFNLTVEAFNLAEGFRLPVFVAVDGYLGIMKEKLEIPEKVNVYNRRLCSGESLFGLNGAISGFVPIGAGENIAYSGLIHHYSGSRSSYSPNDCKEHLKHLAQKLIRIRHPLFWQSQREKDYDYLLISYGLASRATQSVAECLRNRGRKVRCLDLKMIWPLSRKIFGNLDQVKKIIVVENNAGQLIHFLAKYLPKDKTVSFNKWWGEPVGTLELLEFCKQVIEKDWDEEESKLIIHNLPQTAPRKAKKYPFCPGCGHNSFRSAFLSTIKELGINETDILFTSGIGCGSILATTFGADLIKTSHGRSLNAARALKLIYPNRLVVTISGDGDLLNIGGNHLLHTAREKDLFPILCVCLDNFNYGMTGGQDSATTPNHNPFNLKKLLYDGCGIDFFARTSVRDPKHLREALKGAIKFVQQKKSFAFLQVFSPCAAHSAKKHPEWFDQNKLCLRQGIWERQL